LSDAGRLSDADASDVGPLSDAGRLSGADVSDVGPPRDGVAARGGGVWAVPAPSVAPVVPEVLVVPGVLVGSGGRDFGTTA
jgi:hypothetical protein